MGISGSRGDRLPSLGSYWLSKLRLALWVVALRNKEVCSYQAQVRQWTNRRRLLGNPSWGINAHDETQGDLDAERMQAFQAERCDASDPTRRDFLSMGPALMTALSVLGASEQANSAISDATSISTVGSSSYNPDVPYSSVRRYKTIALAKNGLKVLLVSDKSTFRAQCALTVQAGQFCDPDDLPGLAHLMEHMILSYNSKSTFRVSRDFEDWLGDREGASNAFTANQRTCFHFSCPKACLSEALERFASLFLQQNVESVCRDVETLRREVRRVNEELNFDNVYTQVEYIAKAFVNLEHPYSRFSKGSLASLETIPNEMGIDVGERLIQFFRQFYLPSQTILVVIGPQDMSALERWVGPFGFTLSRSKKREGDRIYFPGQFLQGNRYKQLVLYREHSDNSSSDETEKLIFEWVMTQDYRDMMRGGKQAITAPQIAFVINQILGRRGPGSFYAFLVRRGWIQNGSASIPRVSVPVDTSGFQILKLEINLTLEGFLNRSNIVAALYDTIEAVRVGDSFVISREVMAQYATIAKLFGYILAPRPPDAIELAFDAQVYGLEAVGSGKWYRYPSAEELGGLGLNFLRRAVSSTLSLMTDPENALIIATAGDKAIAMSNKALLSDSIPPLESSRWKREPVSGARLYFEDMMQQKSRVEKLVLTKIVDRDELLPPIFNTLVPTVLSRARRKIVSDTSKSVFLWNGVAARNFGGWTMLELPPERRGLPLPRSPPEPSCRCSFVLQLLSPRPARADVRQAARAELWKLSFEQAITDLAELGAPGGLAYDISFNKYGLRLTFLGVSQTLPSYARRMARRIAQHQMMLLNGPVMLAAVVTSAAIASVSTAPGMSSGRRRRAVSSIRSSTAHDAATEGRAFLSSCTGAVCFTEGDLLLSESIQLLVDLRDILKSSLGGANLPLQASAATPPLDELLYKPVWKPRYASACAIPGVYLMSDACGRIPR